MTISKTQTWLRGYSKLLEISFNSSASIDHKPTSGESREHQILDVLSNLLPKNSSLKRNVIISDSNDKQSNKFDGVLIDEANWPQIYNDDAKVNPLIVAPIESVKIAFEIKSNLAKEDIEKMFLEAKNINNMHPFSGFYFPRISGFSYTCTNINLAYYDFVDNFRKNGTNSPALICVLNKAIFCLVNTSGIPTLKHGSNLTPAIIVAEEDSLLLFVYLLSSFLLEKQNSKVIRDYSKDLFSSLSIFQFDQSFYKKMDEATRNKFKGKGNVKKKIEDIYAELNQ